MDKFPRHPQFPHETGLVYFNHAAVGPWPVDTCNAIKAFADENMHLGSSHYPEWLKTENLLRTELAGLINAGSTDDIALLKNTSEGLSIIAYGLEWNSGDNVVIPANEFPSNKVVWESLKQYGVEVRQIDAQQTDDAEQALIDACDSKTRLISVSSVHYATGFRLNINKIGQFCHENDIIYVIDAIQQIGALPLDAIACQADFIVADGHKWMLGPEGLALFYSHPKAREKLKLNQYGWHMLENLGDFDNPEWQVARSGRRFECGSPNMLATHALLASIRVLTNTGIKSIQESILTSSHKLINYIDYNDDLYLISRTDKERLSGIITFAHQQKTAAEIYPYLVDNHIQCAERGGGIRFSPHFYHQDWEFDRVFEILDTL